jgi:hypothetical protein
VIDFQFAKESWDMSSQEKIAAAEERRAMGNAWFSKVQTGRPPGRRRGALLTRAAGGCRPRPAPLRVRLEVPQQHS